MAIKTARQHPALAIALGLLLCTAPLGAQGPAQLPGDGRDLHAGTLEVPMNKSQIVNADRTIAKAMIGNDEVADVLPLSSRSLYVLGKKMGTTSLTLYDAGGRVIAVMDVAVGPDVETLQSQINSLVPGEVVQARISNDSVVLTGTVSSPAAAHTAERLARTYAGDKVVNLISLGSGQQVMLEVQFAEVDRATGREIGVSGSAVSNGGTFGMVLGRNSQLVPDPDTGLGVLKLESITGQAGILRNAFSIGSLNIEGILNALETKGLARTLAKPTLVAISGEKASFLAGGEFPIPVAQSSSAGSNGGGAAITVEFKTFGVSLAFTPTVLSDKTIHMIVEPEVSEIDANASLTVNGITVPGLRTRRVNTTLELRDGESFAIAGLLQQDSKANISQLPILGSIPILGTLFRSTRYQKGETELLIVVTPRLVAPIRPEQVRLPTDRVREPTDGETFLLGQPYQPRELPPVPDGGDPAATAKGGSMAPKAAAKKDDEYGF